MQHTPKISAVIPAAGLSSRMHKYKPLLPLGNITIVEQTISTLKECSINEIIVVTGHNREKIEPVIINTGARAVFNHNFKSGMLGSIKAGVKALSSHNHGFLLLPVDIPLIRPSSIDAIVSAFNATCKHIIIPQFNNQPGHPPAIPAWLIPQILDLQENSNLGNLLLSLNQQIKRVTLHDQGILMDADTKDTYEKLKERHKSIDTPNKKECLSIIHENLQDENKIEAHLKLVANTATTLARAVQSQQHIASDCHAMQQAGHNSTKHKKNQNINLLSPADQNMELDMNLIYAGALLHDIKRRESNHAKRGSDYLLSLGFPKVADIIAQHMDLTSPLPEYLTEVQIVYFADKLCHGAKIELDYSRRFENKIRQTPHARNTILKRYKHTQLIHSRIEQLAGKSISTIFNFNCKL